MIRDTTGSGIVARVVAAIAAGGMVYLGFVEFFCIAMTGASDDAISAEMDGGSLLS